MGVKGERDCWFDLGVGWGLCVVVDVVMVRVCVGHLVGMGVFFVGIWVEFVLQTFSVGF